MSSGRVLHGSQTYRYLLNIVLMPVHALPGVFESTPYGADVNGVLWTLPVEFACYVMCYAGFRITRFDKKKVALLSVPLVVATLIYFAFFHLSFLSVVRAVLLFYIGVLGWVYRDSLTLSARGGVVAWVLFAVLVALRLDVLAMLGVFPYACAWLVFSPALRNLGARFRTRELSYGIYLWGWPIQQLIVSFWPQQPMFPVVNTVIGCILALVASMLNDAIVERRIMGKIALQGKTSLRE